MNADSAAAYLIRTATGVKALDPDDGYTLPHEHVLCDVRARWHGPGSGRQPDPPGRFVSADTIDEVRHNPQGSIRENLVLSDWHLAAEELRAATATGCQLIVDLTVEGLGPQPRATARAAREAGLHVVVGVGRYIADALNSAEHDVTEGALVDRWHRQITDGLDGCTVGVIGELGVGTAFPHAEQRTLAAAAEVSRHTGLPIVVHLEIGTSWLEAALAVLEQAGADPSRVVLSHLDWRIDLPTILAVLRRGYTASFDLFGRSSLRRPGGEPYADTDDQRIDALTELVEHGHAERLLLSHDICMRHCLLRYGGYGYVHLAHSIMPRLRRTLGDEVLRQITRINPLRMLAIESIPPRPGGS